MAEGPEHSRKSKETGGKEAPPAEGEAGLRRRCVGGRGGPCSRAGGEAGEAVRGPKVSVQTGRVAATRSTEQRYCRAEQPSFLHSFTYEIAFL